MASQGPLSPAAAATGTIDNVGSAWINPTDCFSSNNSYAQVNVNNISTGQTESLEATQFGFTIPAGSTIDGIVVEIEKSEQNNEQNVVDREVKLIKNGAGVGTNKADGTLEWPTTDTYKIYGDPNGGDLWGTTWTPAQINATNDFGVYISADQNGVVGGAGSSAIRVDHIRITVYYTPPPKSLGKFKKSSFSQAVNRSANY